MYCIFLAFEVVFVYFMFPETHGKTLEELAFSMYTPICALKSVLICALSVREGRGQEATGSRRAGSARRHQRRPKRRRVTQWQHIQGQLRTLRSLLVMPLRANRIFIAYHDSVTISTTCIITTQ